MGKLRRLLTGIGKIKHSIIYYHAPWFATCLLMQFTAPHLHQNFQINNGHIELACNFTIPNRKALFGKLKLKKGGHVTVLWDGELLIPFMGFCFES